MRTVGHISIFHHKGALMMEAQAITDIPVNSARSRQLIATLKKFYQHFSPDSIAGLEELYTQDVEFRDPVHVVHGSLALRNYLRKMAVGLTHYDIRYLDQVLGENSAALVWELDYAHPRIAGGKVLTLRGISHLRFTNKVYYHEDCYDLGAMVYEHLPLLGTLITRIRKQMAGGN